MIYVDSKFRFYDDAKDLAKFPELKPTPDAVPLTDEQVTEITADITRWRWHPVNLRPYKIPDCAKKYWKTVDGVIVEMNAEEKAVVDCDPKYLKIVDGQKVIMSDVEKAVVDQAIADAEAAEAAAAQAEADRIAAKAQAIIDNLPSRAQVITLVKAAFPDVKQQNIMLKFADVLYWLAKDKAD